MKIRSVVCGRRGLLVLACTAWLAPAGTASADLTSDLSCETLLEPLPAACETGVEPVTGLVPAVPLPGAEESVPGSEPAPAPAPQGSGSATAPVPAGGSSQPASGRRVNAKRGKRARRCRRVRRQLRRGHLSRKHAKKLRAKRRKYCRARRR